MYPQSMFWSKNKKNRYTPVLLYKSGVQGGMNMPKHLSMVVMKTMGLCGFVLSNFT